MISELFRHVSLTKSYLFSNKHSPTNSPKLHKQSWLVLQTGHANTFVCKNLINFGRIARKHMQCVQNLMKTEPLNSFSVINNSQLAFHFTSKISLCTKIQLWKPWLTHTTVSYLWLHWFQFLFQLLLWTWNDYIYCAWKVKHWKTNREADPPLYNIAISTYTIKLQIAMATACVGNLEK